MRSSPVATLDTLGPADEESVNRLVDRFERMSAQFLQKSFENPSESDQSITVDSLKSHEAILNAYFNSEKYAAAASIMRTGQYFTFNGPISDDLFPDGQFERIMIGPVRLAGSGKLATAFVPIPIPDFPQLGEIWSEIGRLKSVILGEFMYEFNSKPDEERRRLCEEHAAAREELAVLRQGAPSSETRKRIVELGKRLLPSGVHIRKTSFTLHARE